MNRALLLIALLLPACPGQTVVEPDPRPDVVVPEPEPDPYMPPVDAAVPEPQDAGAPLSACDRAEARAIELRCPGAGPRFSDQCDRRSLEPAPALRWSAAVVECMQHAPDCVALSRCKGLR